jgi:5-aminopentanamidase
MRVTSLELPAAWGPAKRGLADVEKRLASGPTTDLVLLPEQALNGYLSPEGDADLTLYAEAIDGPVANACAKLARQRSIHLVAPLVLREGGAVYNAMVCYRPDGTHAFVYRKRHPWFPEEWATAGTEPLPVVELGGLRVTIAICYDLHFLADESATQLRAADLLLFPSAWVERPDMRARRLAVLAEKFDIAVVNANWAPGVVRLPDGQGRSVAIGRDGRVLATAPLASRFDVEISPA